MGLAAALMLVAPAGVLAAATGWVGDDHSAARLITATDATRSAATIAAGLEIRLAPGWHAYWRSPGDAGIPPSIDWAGSDNLKNATISWPAPRRYSLQGFETAGYRDHVVLPISLTLARPGQAAHLHAKADWAACAEICVPYSAKFDLPLPAGPAAPSPQAALIAAAQSNVPSTLAAAGLQLQSATVANGGGDPHLVVSLASPGAVFGAPDLFVEGIAKGSPGRPEVELSQQGHAARLVVPIRDACGGAIAGSTLHLTFVDGARAAEFAATPLPGPPAAAPARILSIIGIALLGGLILNAMPCVLPVLSLKLLAVASQAGEDRRRVRLGLLMTAAGVLASFAVLAAALMALRAAGAAVGWGIQFQWPWFVAGMAALTTLFAASLWGWLPIALPRAIYDAAGAVRPRRPYTDAFLTGAFATLLATPCSAPFVGTAIGFALSQGPAQIAFVFAAMSLGLASPYLLVAAAPRLVAFLPRPGRWLYILRALLGAALAGTALWLLFVLAALTGVGAALGTGAALALVLLLLALKSRRGTPVLAARFASAATAVVIAGSVLWPAFAGVEHSSPSSSADRWQKFDPAAIPQLVAAGKTVLVDVGAAWCLTCKVNEAVVLDSGRVADRLFGPGVVAMRADWTRPDPAITAYLESFGRYGVPFDAVYGPARPAGEALPELLSPGIVEAALDRAAASSPPAR